MEPFRFLCSSNHQQDVGDFRIVNNAVCEEFSIQVGKIQGHPTAIILLPVNGFRWVDGRETNRIRADIRWLIESLAGHKLVYRRIDQWYIGWTTYAKLAHGSPFPMYVGKAGLYHEPYLVWEWIKYICSQSLTIQHTGGLWDLYNNWKRQHESGRVQFD